MEFRLLNFSQDGEHNATNLVEISKIFEIQEAFSFGALTFNRMYSNPAELHCITSA